MKIPTWGEVHDTLRNGKELNGLEQFIYSNDPADEDQSAQFFFELKHLIDYIRSY